MKVFARNLMTLAPDGVTLPPELIEVFDWLEDQGWLDIREGGQPEDHSLFIYPPQARNQLGASHVVFGGTNLKYTEHWSAPNAAVDTRIFEIATTAGDGGRAAIWRDEMGKQHFVQLGHDTAGLITDDPLVFMQYLAMGYPEPGSLEQTDITPQQAFFDFHGVYDLNEFPPDERPVAPAAFQEFLKTHFGLEMPATAQSIGITDFPYYQEPDTSDPFSRWLTSVTPPPTQEELDYIDELTRTIESLDIKDDDSTQMMMEKIGSLFEPKE